MHWVGVRIAFERGIGEGREIYLAIMLPGNATLTVHSRPLVGWKMAVGREVSTAVGVLDEEGPFEAEWELSLGCALASDWRLRFCRSSVNIYIA